MINDTVHRLFSLAISRRNSEALIWLAMEEKNLNQTQFAKTLGVNEKEVRRIIDPSHNTKLETLERSLFALGKKPVLYVA